MLGGTVWKIVKDGEEDIIYAADYNHKKERRLNGCELEKIQRPSLLITDAYNARYRKLRRRTRDEQLMTNLQTLRWKCLGSCRYAAGRPYLNNVTYNVNQFANGCLTMEWMSDKLMKSFEGARNNNPFEFKYVCLIQKFTIRY